MVGVGFCYMTATLIQLDLAARVCPPEIVATAFALLMAMVNLATSSASFLEGRFYAWGAERWSHEVAFHGLIVIGAVFTASCWLLVPFLPKENQAPVNTP